MCVEGRRAHDGQRGRVVDALAVQVRRGGRDHRAAGGRALGEGEALQLDEDEVVRRRLHVVHPLRRAARQPHARELLEPPLRERACEAMPRHREGASSLVTPRPTQPGCPEPSVFCAVADDGVAQPRRGGGGDLRVRGGGRVHLLGEGLERRDEPDDALLACLHRPAAARLIASHGIASHGIASHGMAWHGMAWHSTA